ncbi:MAG TPA: IPT/TIG domain-containing protein, partial [Acidobacteriaceae bacterium]|nr:IPT/TIG domain-containing protein [Acidobacteriaceae bacterium]
AARITGTIAFPPGEGMQGVNLVVRRVPGGSTTPQDYQDTSSVSGFLFQQNAGNPVMGAASGISGSLGSTDVQLQGLYDLAWIPEVDPLGSSNGSMAALVSTEPINPLYVGEYAVGPYPLGAVAPSGAAQSATTQAPPYDGSHPAVVNFNPSDAAPACSPADGTEFSPAAVPSTGVWSSLLCGHTHSAWSSISLAANRTATIEVTALDESGAATTAKAMPLIGVWSRSDPLGSLPTLAATQSAFNTIALGVSAAHVSTSQATDIRFAIADARGDGRPDFPYRAQVLYAAQVQPATIPLSGGPITITGTGFTAGVQVEINGAPAAILQSTPTSLVVTAPASASARTVDVAVFDPSTGGSSTMYSALAYSTSAQPDVMALLSAPSGTVTVGVVAATPFTVRVFQTDGVTPAAGVAVTFSVTSGSATLNACGAATCIVLTDASGTASTTVTPSAAGAISLLASTSGASRSASFTAAARTLIPVRATEFVAAGVSVTWPAQVIATENGASAAGIAVAWTGSGSLIFASATSTTNSAGLAQSAATVSPLAAGATAAGQACAWTTVCASISAVAVDPSAWRVVLVSGGGQSIASTGKFVPVVVRISDTAGHPIAGAPVVLHQTVTAATLPCPVHGACPIAPTLDASVTTATSDADGLVSITPMQMQSTAEATNIVVATGTQGFLQLSLQQFP